VNRRCVPCSSGVLVFAIVHAATCFAFDPAPSETAIAALISELDNEQYEVREAATRKLVDAGGPAVRPLAEAAATGSLEMGVRAIRVLETLYTSGDEATVVVVEEALDRLSESKNRSIASRAARVFSAQRAVHERLAIARISKLGGMLTYRDDQLAARPLVAEEIPNDRQIETVILSGDWKGGDEGLKYVKRIEDLQTLIIVEGANVTEKALNDLQSAAPDLRIDRRGLAFLGVSMEGRSDCRISSVKDGSAAHKAGLLPGDMVLQFGEVAVKNPDDVISKIKTLKPGDKIKVLVERNARTLTLDVVVGSWSKLAKNKDAGKTAEPKPVE
jgi:hypothetical protein